MASRPIDEKIVVMKLDNTGFKAKAAETTSIFGKLRSLFAKSGDTNLNKVTNDLNGISRAANKVDMNGLARSVEAVSSRFSTLGVVATTALMNITNRAVDAGMRLQKSLSTDQVIDGWREYELKMGSIQTILANTQKDGTGLDDVKKSLEELNQYADQTIYDFGEMTRNIGFFTNAGLKLEESTSMIKGFSNAAAASGANSEQASRAAYQLSQGLMSGYIMTQDWMSLTNAGMGNDNMRRDLIAIGQAMGQLTAPTDQVLTEWKDFLSEDKWLTADVMSNYLQAMAGDLDKAALLTIGLTEAQADMLLQNAKTGMESAVYVRTFSKMMDAIKESIGSGWAETFELIFGDFEQATILWTGLKDVADSFFSAQSDARNNLIKDMIDNGAFEAFGRIIMNVGTPIVQIFKAIGDAFKGIFPPVESTGLVTFLTFFADLTEHLKIGTGAIEAITAIFKGLFSIVGLGVEAFKILLGAVVGLIPGFDGAGGGILAFISNFAKIPTKILEYVQTSGLAEKATESLKSVFEGIGSVLSFIGNLFMDTSVVMMQMYKALSSGDVKSGLLKEDSTILTWLTKLHGGLETIFGYVSKIPFESIGSGISSFFSGISNTFDWVIAKFKGVVEFFKGFFPMIADNQGWILAGGGLAATAAIFWKVYEVIRNIVGVSSKVGETLEGVSDALGAFTLGIHARSLLTISIAVAMLAGSLYVLSGIDGPKIAISLTAIVVALSALVGALAIINKFGLTANAGAIMAMIGMASAVLLLSFAMSSLGKMPISEATKGVLTISALMLALSGSMALMGKFGGSFAASAAQLLAVAGTIGILVLVIKQLSDVNPSAIAKGVSTIGVLLLELGLFMKLASSRVGAMTAGATGILAVGGAILIMTQAIKQIAKIDPGDIVKGVVTIGALLTAIGAFTLVVKDAQLIALGVSLVLLAGAITALIIPIMILGNANLSTIAIGLTAIGVALAAFALTSKFMTASIPAAIAIGLLAVALNLLVIPIIALGQLSWETLLTGIGGLALALLAFGGVAAILGVVSPALILFSVALATLGLGFLAIGAGMKLLATGLLLLSTLTVASVAVMVGAFGAFLTGLGALAPVVADLFMKVILAIGDVMLKMAPQVVDVIGKIMIAVLEKVKEYTPKILEIVNDVLISILEALGGFIQEAVTVVLDFLLSMLGVVAEYVPQFIQAGTDIIIAFLRGIEENVPLVIDTVAEVVITMIEAMADSVDENGDAFINAIMRLMAEVIELVITAGLTMIQALFGWIPGVSEATQAIGEAASKYLEENFKTFDLGDGKGKDFSKGLGDTSKLSETAGALLAASGKTGMESVDASSSGEWFGAGFVNGITSKANSVWEAAKGLASTAYNAIKEELDINSPSRETDELGNNTGTGFANGIESTRNSVIGAMFGLSNGVKKEAAKAVPVAESTGTKVGTSTTKGIEKGLKKGAPKAKKTAKKTAKDIASEAMSAFREKVDELDFKLEFGTIDSKKHMAGIKALGKEYAKYPRIVHEVNKKVKQIEEDARKESFEKSTSYLDDRKYYNEITLKEELKAWERIQGRYAKGTEQRKQADREIYRLKKELVQEEEDLVRKGFDNSKKWIDDRKGYNEMSLKAELEAWERVQARYDKGTEERKEADKEVYRLKKELYDAMVSLNEEYFNKVKETNQKLIDDEKALNDKYEDAFASRYDAIRSGLGGIFSEFKVDAEVSGTKLLDNLRSQLNGMMNWSRQLKELASKGIDEGLLAELRKMGPSAASEINALTQMSSLELAEYSSVWKATNELARLETISELEGMRADIDGQITQLHDDAKKQLEEYKNEWLKKMKEIRTGVPDQFGGLSASMEDIGRNALKGLQKGLRDMTGPLLKDAQNIGKSITDAMNGVLNTNISSNAKSEADKVKGAVTSMLNSLDLSKDVNVRAVMSMDDTGLAAFDDDQTVKMGARTVVPDVSHTNQMADGVNQRTYDQRTAEQNNKSNDNIVELTSAVRDLVDKPQTTNLIVDGRKMASVVSGHQYKETNLGAMRRG